MSDTFSIVCDGIRVVGPTKPKRNAYIRVGVTVVEPGTRSPMACWDDAVSIVSDIYGAYPTEDGTVGQHAQVSRVQTAKGAVFSFGLNLYGKPARALAERIAERTK